MFMLGYWAMGNRQIFYNVVIAMTNFSNPIDPGHDTYLPIAYDHTLVILIFLGALILYLVVIRYRTK